MLKCLIFSNLWTKQRREKEMSQSVCLEEKGVNEVKGGEGKSGEIGNEGEGKCGIQIYCESGRHEPEKEEPERNERNELERTGREEPEKNERNERERKRREEPDRNEIAEPERKGRGERERKGRNEPERKGRGEPERNPEKKLERNEGEEPAGDPEEMSSVEDDTLDNLDNLDNHQDSLRKEESSLTSEHIEYPKIKLLRNVAQVSPVMINR